MSMLPQRSQPAAGSLLRPFYPALDGLRAVAFLMVFGTHYLASLPHMQLFDWGWAGVDCFFVLSGFLITGILYDSLQGDHFFRNFYVRRALRIFPLFYGLWILFLLATPVLHIAWNRYNAAMAFYVGNFFVTGGNSYLHPNPGQLLIHPGHIHGGYRRIVLSHFWTLCVEEQFYLIWPAVLWLVRSRRKLWNLSLVIIATVPLLRMAYIFIDPIAATQGALYCGTIFRIDTIFVGAALALWLRGNPPSPATIRRGASIVACVAPMILAVGYAFTRQALQLAAFNLFVTTIGFTLIAVTFGAVLLLTIHPSTVISRALQIRPLMFLGRISYGLYVFHYLPAGFVKQAAIRLAPYHLQGLPALVTLGVTIALAWLSFRFFETPFLRLKSKLAPTQQTVPPQTPVMEGVPAFLQPVRSSMRSAA